MIYMASKHCHVQKGLSSIVELMVSLQSKFDKPCSQVSKISQLSLLIVLWTHKMPCFCHH